jgi:hypothetical protein
MSTIAEHLTRLVTILRAAIGLQVARQQRPPQPVWLGAKLYVPFLAPQKRPPLPIAVLALFHQRLDRLAERFQSLFDKWRAGRLPSPRRRTHAPRRTAPGLRLPRGFAWAHHRLPEAAPPAGMLESLLLNEAETRRFVEEAPQAGRYLRPLCQALGIAQPEWLKLPPRPRKPRAPKPRPERPWRLTDPRLGLQPYVITAARAERKKAGA